MAIWTVTVTINQDGLGVFKADVAPDPLGPVADGDTIDWNITEPAGFPQDAEVFLQFFKRNGAGKKIFDKGCLRGGNNGKHNGSSTGAKKKLIKGNVEAAPKSGKKSHWYLMAYTATMGSGTLVDPEIVVDGGQLVTAGHGNRHRAARRKLLAKRAQLAARRKQLRRARATRAAKAARR
jgi:hypothetical protein